MNDGGKGSTQRPTDQEAFAKAWERIFGEKVPKRLEGNLQPVDFEAMNLRRSIDAEVLQEARGKDGR